MLNQQVNAKQVYYQGMFFELYLEKHILNILNLSVDFELIFEHFIKRIT